MMPHYRKDLRYPRTICWSGAALVGLLLWWMLITALSTIGPCVLNGAC